MELKTPLDEKKSKLDSEDKFEDDVDDFPSDYKWYHINSDSLPAKFAYTFEACRRLSYTPNLVLFLTGIGLSKTESGYVMGFRYDQYVSLLESEK